MLLINLILIPASGDYVSLSTNLTFDASTTRHCVNISTPEDGRVEAPEDFGVVLVPVDGDVGVIFSPERTVVTVAESQSECGEYDGNSLGSILWHIFGE